MKMLVAPSLYLVLVVPTFSFPAGTTLEVKGLLKMMAAFIQT